MLAHGATKFCRERLMEVSDQFTAYLCKACGLVAPINDFSNILRSKESVVKSTVDNRCLSCNNSTDFARIEIPYAFKLMTHELQTVNCVPRFVLQ
jgi:DNA-directed RNA polymerase II subunit RPB2